MALDASQKKEAIAHFPVIFGFFRHTAKFLGLRHKSNVFDKLIGANMFVRFLTMNCDSGQLVLLRTRHAATSQNFPKPIDSLEYY